MTLSLSTLREANIHRLPQFKNPHGVRAHSRDDGSDWSPAQWLQAVVGELGEYANLRKKFERGDISREQFAVAAAKELADVQIYLDLLAQRCLDNDGFADPDGVDLSFATVEKFNEVSIRVGATTRIVNDRVWHNGPNGIFDVERALVRNTVPAPAGARPEREAKT